MDNRFFQRWEIDGVANVNYDVDNIAWTGEGLAFTIISDGAGANQYGHKLLLIWESSSVIAYHVTDETYRSDCWGLDFQKNGRFYATKTSKYIDELRDKSPLFPEESSTRTIPSTISPRSRLRGSIREKSQTGTGRRQKRGNRRIPAQ